MGEVTLKRWRGGSQTSGRGPRAYVLDDHPPQIAVESDGELVDEEAIHLTESERRFSLLPTVNRRGAIAISPLYHGPTEGGTA
jgi:hypothetical protein